MLSLIRRKACKRCGGNLSIECDVYGIYIECIQCGATWNKEDLTPASPQQNENVVKATPAVPLAATAVQR
jgi:hypothetical protein